MNLRTAARGSVQTEGGKAMRTIEAATCRTGVASGRRALAVGGVLLLALLVAPACDLSVTNPGPVQDQFLDDPKAFAGIVNGMGRAYSGVLGVDGMGAIVKFTACVTRELFPSGNLLDHGCDIREEEGLLLPSMRAAPWNNAHNARFVAEDGIRRMEEVLGAAADADVNVARALLWAGFSNRLLGENMCQAVFDGGSPQPSSEHFERAEAQFTRAIAIATTIGSTQDALRLAAIAGRASVRVGLGDWAGAVSDAGSVPRSFKFQVQYENITVTTYNMLVWAKASSPFRSLSVWNTPFLQYYTDSNDPRTPWVYNPARPFGELNRPCCGQVPFYAQTKYNNVTDPINVVTGREMLLIRAEAFLRNGQLAEAMGFINDSLRATVGVAPWTATTLAEGWTRLKRERGIELWLEGRRLGDLRRWDAEGTPGDLDPLEDASNAATYLSPNRSLCFPIPQSEIDTNPNVG